MEMGGVEKVLLSMLNNLDKDKFDVQLCLNLFQGELRNDIPKNIPFKTFAKGKEDFSSNSLVNKVQLALRGGKLLLYRTFPSIPDTFILKNDADVEIATGYTMFADVLNSSNKKSKKIGWLHSDITTAGFKPILSLLLKQIERFDYIIFGSQQSKDIIINNFPHLKIPPNKVILNAIPIEKIKEKALEFTTESSTIPTFVSVGRLHNRKGYHLLIDAHKKLLEQGFKHRIQVIGDGEEYENLKTQINDLKLQNTFSLLGTQMNPYPYVKNADFYIMPSRSEGWPLIIAETLILQKPIIATNVGGIPEMIEHKKNGYLIDYNVDSIISGMKEFLTNETLITNLKEELKKSEEKFDNAKIYQSVEKILQEII